MGNQDPTINLSEDIRTAKSDEIVERAGVGNDDHAQRLLGLRRKQPIQRSHVPIEILYGVVVDFMLLQECVHLHARCEAEKFASLFHRESAIPGSDEKNAPADASQRKAE